MACLFSVSKMAVLLPIFSLSTIIQVAAIIMAIIFALHGLLAIGFKVTFVLLSVYAT